MEAWREKLASDIFCHKFLQFEFRQQWQTLKQYANERQIQIIGDIPIYVAHDSVDVWAYTDNFMIDPETWRHPKWLECHQITLAKPDNSGATPPTTGRCLRA
jgi:4-alpha-glucanotransferase